MTDQKIPKQISGSEALKQRRQTEGIYKGFPIRIRRIRPRAGEATRLSYPMQQTKLLPSDIRWVVVRSEDIGRAIVPLVPKGTDVSKLWRELHQSGEGIHP